MESPNKKDARKQTCLIIEKYKGNSVSEIEMEEKYLSMRPTGYALAECCTLQHGKILNVMTQ